MKAAFVASLALLSLACFAAAETAFYQDAAFLELAGYNPFPKDLPFAGNGTCGERKDLGDGTFTVRCLGPAHPLKPGQTVNTMMYLENPYPTEGNVIVYNLTSQLVDAEQRPVPLSDVYVHHYVSSSAFLLGNGAELRGSFSRQPVKEPFALVIDTEKLKNDTIRYTNIQLINTIGVAEEDKRECLECWCKDNKNHGSFFCCKDCPAKEGPSKDYHLEYTVTYRPLTADDTDTKKVQFIGFDITGGKIEYDILASQGPNTTLRRTYDTVIDDRCPQKKPFEVVRCIAHQHPGSECMYMYNMDKDELICKSCPVYGTEEGVPGNEDGYVVKMTDGDPSPPYLLEPGTRVRLVSDYSAAERRLGVMGLMSVWVGGMDKPCTGQFGASAMSAMSMSTPATAEHPLKNGIYVA